MLHIRLGPGSSGAVPSRSTTEADHGPLGHGHGRRPHAWPRWRGPRRRRCGRFPPQPWAAVGAGRHRRRVTAPCGQGGQRRPETVLRQDPQVEVPGQVAQLGQGPGELLAGPGQGGVDWPLRVSTGAHPSASTAPLCGDGPDTNKRRRPGTRPAAVIGRCSDLRRKSFLRQQRHAREGSGHAVAASRLRNEFECSE